jgi:hypothetical protein
LFSVIGERISYHQRHPFQRWLKIGNQYCQLYALADVEDLPSLCGARINYDKYSTDRTKFSVGFASPLGQLLSCNHMYKQFIFIEDAQKTIKQLESKRLRLHSLSAYSRGNATNDFLNEAISQQLQPEGKPLLLQHDLRQHQPGHRGGQRAD